MNILMLWNRDMKELIWEEFARARTVVLKSLLALMTQILEVGSLRMPCLLRQLRRLRIRSVIST